MPLRVAFVHYHLRPGGVTRVIDSAVASLAGHDVEPAILTGEPSAQINLPNCQVVEGLGYADENASESAPEDLAASLTESARRAFRGKTPDLWHIHNHSLGKNIAFPMALKQLADSGAPLLLQVHDFAEDGRPHNYRTLRASASRDNLSQTIYPVGGRIHYAALNRRDLNVLNQAGAPPQAAHYLPNPVPVPTDAPSCPRAGIIAECNRITLYPVRGIRRKNLGEFLLWSTAAAAGERFALTLAPANPREHGQYHSWRAFAEELQLPALFGAADLAPFESWVAHADRFITTSVAEGFGLAFLEPATIAKPLVGRNLPDITADFNAAGIDLSHLYNRLGAPLDLVDRPTLRQRVEDALHDSFAAYCVAPPSDAARRAIESRIEDDTIDFGFLDEPLQTGVIRAARDSPELRSSIFRNINTTGAPKSNSSRSREIVNGQFNLPAYGQRLLSIYQSLLDSKADRPDKLDADRILNAFLAPERFTLLRA